jgi:hypothetical protein
MRQWSYWRFWRPGQKVDKNMPLHRPGPLSAHTPTRSVSAEERSTMFQSLGEKMRNVVFPNQSQKKRD